MFQHQEDGEAPHISKVHTPPEDGFPKPIVIKPFDVQVSPTIRKHQGQRQNPPAAANHSNPQAEALHPQDHQPGRQDKG